MPRDVQPSVHLRQLPSVLLPFRIALVLLVHPRKNHPLARFHVVLLCQLQVPADGEEEARVGARADAITLDAAYEHLQKVGGGEAPLGHVSGGVEPAETVERPGQDDPHEAAKNCAVHVAIHETTRVDVLVPARDIQPPLQEAHANHDRQQVREEEVNAAGQEHPPPSLVMETVVVLDDRLARHEEVRANQLEGRVVHRILCKLQEVGTKTGSHHHEDRRRQDSGPLVIDEATHVLDVEVQKELHEQAQAAGLIKHKGVGHQNQVDQPQDALHAVREGVLVRARLALRHKRMHG
mmetsp:Transcript_36743/g.85491  ORF Transcript_36743/g.85491 Transcript_36743/m.85491 type:complete len:294 (+) Transcript_36743:1423-2304(+)